MAENKQKGFDSLLAEALKESNLKIKIPLREKETTFRRIVSQLKEDGFSAIK